MVHKKIYRSETDKIIAGVCGGIAEYFGTDAWVVRIIFAISALFGLAGVILYLILWVILPEKNHMENNSEHAQEHAHEHGHPQNGQNFRHHRTRGVIGLALILIGAVLLLNNLFPSFEIQKYWPILLVLIGAGFMLRD